MPSDCISMVQKYDSVGELSLDTCASTFILVQKDEYIKLYKSCKKIYKIHVNLLA